MNEKINKIYSEIATIYTGNLNINSQKANLFRIQLEDFLQFYLNNNELKLNDLIKDFYKLHDSKLLNDATHKLKNRLNVYHHPGYIEPPHELITEYFQQIITIIYKSTGIKPDNGVLSLIQVNDDYILKDLNARQKMAVLSEDKIVYVNAGPGTGKTHLLVNKIFHQIKSAKQKEKIVALSYTNSAADQLADRINAKLFLAEFKDYDLFTGTIHSFAFKCLRSFAIENEESPVLYTLLDEDETDYFVNEIISIFIDEHRIQKEIILKLIDESEEELLESGLQKRVSEEIRNLKNRFKILSFKDILNKFLENLEKDAKFKDWLKNRITLFVVDEAQDLTKLEYKIISLVNQFLETKIFLVGDPRQNLFSFNGGSFKHLTEFLEINAHFFKELVLDISYRCPDSIFNFVNRFKFIDCNNYPITSINSKSCNGELELIEYPSKSEEAVGLVELIKLDNIISKTAILAPSLKYFNELAALLNSENIPFRTFGGRLRLKEHIRFFIHCLKVKKNPENYLSWKYILRYAFFNRSSLSKLSAIDLSEIGKSLNSSEIGASLFSILTIINIEESFACYCKKLIPITLSIVNNLEPSVSIEQITIEQITEDFDDLLELIESYLAVDDFLLSFSSTNKDFRKFYVKDLVIESKNKDANNALTLSTIHSAKGLEWDNVIIPGMSERLFPNPFFCYVKDDIEKTKENFNNQLKALYVAATRTKSRLIITYPKSHYQNGHRWPLQKSRFLEYFTVGQ